MRPRIITVVLLSLLAAGCGDERQPDAYGNVEATEVVVSSEVGGQLTTFAVEEGQTLAAGEMVATIDPTSLGLQRDQAAAQRGAATSSAGGVTRQSRRLAA